ncbi:MAG: hypothetical protein WD830_10150 [Chloroflexota bacterium]
MKRIAFAMSLVLVTAAALATLAGAQPTGTVDATAGPKKQKVLLGFYKNRTVKYFEYGQIKLRPGNKVAPMWVFTNGADGQRSIVDSAPGATQYSALHKVNSVTWTTSSTPRVLRSASAVKEAQGNGDLTITSTSRVVNAALLGFGQTRHAGFAKNQVIHYYELGVVKVAAGNEILPIWTFTNGVEGQRNIADVVPGKTAYPPLWAVVEVTWTSGAEPRLVRSFEQLQQARKAGDVTLKKTSMVVNCPFV